jgi:hypothetical protein
MPLDPDTEIARAELHRSIMAAFSNVLHGSRLHPMTVMSLVAAAVGSVYKEIADEHRSGACPCGWNPNPRVDVEALQTALAATTHTLPPWDLRVIQIAGRA